MKKIERDGHCLFASIALLLRYKLSKEELRKKAVDHVLYNFEEFEHHLGTRQPKPYWTRQEYRRGLKNDQGDQTEIIALGHVVEKRIILHEMDQTNNKLHSYTVAEPANPTGTFHLIRGGGNHFHAAETGRPEKENQVTHQLRTQDDPPP